MLEGYYFGPNLEIRFLTRVFGNIGLGQIADYFIGYDHGLDLILEGEDGREYLPASSKQNERRLLNIYFYGGFSVKIRIFTPDNWDEVESYDCLLEVWKNGKRNWWEKTRIPCTVAESDILLAQTVLGKALRKVFIKGGGENVPPESDWLTTKEETKRIYEEYGPFIVVFNQKDADVIFIRGPGEGLYKVGGLI